MKGDIGYSSLSILIISTLIAGHPCIFARESDNSIERGWEQVEKGEGEILPAEVYAERLKALLRESIEGADIGESCRELSSVKIEGHGGELFPPIPICGELGIEDGERLSAILEVFSGSEPEFSYPELERARSELTELYLKKGINVMEDEGSGTTDGDIELLSSFKKKVNSYLSALFSKGEDPNLYRPSLYHILFITTIILVTLFILISLSLLILRGRSRRGKGESRRGLWYGDLGQALPVGSGAGGDLRLVFLEIIEKLESFGLLSYSKVKTGQEILNELKDTEIYPPFLSLNELFERSFYGGEEVKDDWKILVDRINHHISSMSYRK